MRLESLRLVSSGAFWLEFNLSGAPELIEAAIELISIEDLGRERSPRLSFQLAITCTATLLVLNLVRVADARGSWLSVPARKGWYASNRHWIGTGVTAAAVAVVVQALHNNGYVDYDAGRSSGSRAFRRNQAIRPTPKFVGWMREHRCTVHDLWTSPSVNIIRLRSTPDARGQKRPVGFEPTGDTMLMEYRLERINNGLLGHWPDLELTDAQWQDMLTELERKEGEDAYIDLTRRTLYRVFNNGTFEDGGRFYGPWWQMVPSRYRPYITIDGKRSVEVDYSAMHPTFLYHELGLELPENPYEIGIGTKKLVKRTFNALINARGTNLRPVEGFSEQAVGMPWSEFLTEVKAHFSPFSLYFGTGYGLKLQRMDSDIAEAVMLQFAEQGIPILPVHDSFLCHHGNEDILRISMEEKFYWRTGAKVKLHVTGLSDDQDGEIRSLRNAEHDRLIAGGLSEIEALISYDHAYGAHDQRVDQWFSKRNEIRSVINHHHSLSPYMEPLISS